MARQKRYPDWLLEAALLELQARLAEVDDSMAYLRKHLKLSSHLPKEPMTRAYKISAETRERMSKAQFRRWAKARRHNQNRRKR
jgi:hypothetical protein